MNSPLAVESQPTTRLHWIDLSRGTLIVFILSIHFIEFKLTPEHREFILRFLPDFLDDSTLVFAVVSGITLTYLRRRKTGQFEFPRYCLSRSFRLCALALILFLLSPMFVHLRLPDKEWFTLLHNPSSTARWGQHKFIFGIGLFCLFAPLPYLTRSPVRVSAAVLIGGLLLFSGERAPILMEMILSGFLGIVLGESIQHLKLNPQSPQHAYTLGLLIIVIAPEIFPMPWENWRNTPLGISPTILFFLLTLCKSLGVICLANVLMRGWKYWLVKKGITTIGLYSLFTFTLQHFYLSAFGDLYFHISPERGAGLLLLVVSSYLALPSMALSVVAIRRRCFKGWDLYLKKSWGI